MLIKCPECQFENTEGALYCGRCGTSLVSSASRPPFEGKTMKMPLKRGTIFAHRYEIIEQLGKGGMGDVFRVLDTQVNEEVALKILNPDVAADKITIHRFRNELKMARRISHKNVCRMYHIGEEAGIHYITMEYVPGENLGNMIRMTGLMGLTTAVNIAKQVCEGLAEAHSLGVVHRDLKPSNIIIDREGNARILDFGIARSLRAKGETGMEVMIGTPAYMSPEQAETNQVDPRSDIYSFGVILFEMLTGKVPFEGDTALSVVMKHKSVPPPDPRSLNPQIPENISRVILKCLEKEKKNRYQTVGELIVDLGRILAEDSKKGKAVRRIKKIKKMASKNGILYTGAFFLTVLLVLIGIFIFRDQRQTLDSIAVLPFENVNADPSTEYLSDGITESIINKLTQLPRLRKVIACSSVFQYKGRDKDPQSVGQELGVDALLMSRMRRRGDELSISVELVNTRDNSLIWGHQYRSMIEDIFDVQEEISNSIIDNLRLRLTGEEQARIAKRHTENTEAFEAYYRGRYFWNRRTETDLQRAIGYFSRAIELDPNYALAYTGLANSYLLLPEYGTLYPKEGYPKAKQAAVRALAIDDMLAEARVTLAQLKKRFDYDWPAAEREYKRAIELDPGYATAHHWYAYDLMCMARHEEAIREIERAYELDPLSLVINRNRGQVYYRAGLYDQAMEALNKTLELDPGFSYTHFHIGSIHLQERRYEEALDMFQQEMELSKGWSSRIAGWIGVARAKMGQKAQAEMILEELLERSKQEYVSKTIIAILCFALEKDDLGFQCLEEGYQEYDSWLRLIKVEPIFARVSTDPRYTELLEKMSVE